MHVLFVFVDEQFFGAVYGDKHLNDVPLLLSLLHCNSALRERYTDILGVHTQ